VTLANIRLAVRRPWGLFLTLVVIGFGLRLAYGIARYQSDLIDLSDREFIAQWDFDALEHVLIARALLSGKGYVVDDLPGMEGKHIRGVGQDAVFKAPFYQFFLAGLFALSGFSFVLFFPIQALLGGLVSGFAGLITLETFKRPAAAWLAGAAAAAHPVLVNSAAQPYNENLFFFLFLAALWTFTRWLENERRAWAIGCGILVALGILTRESALSLFVVMLIFGLVAVRHKPEALAGLGAMVLVTAILIAPWSVRNYVRLGLFVPVASIVGGALLEGNNDCLAHESLLTPFIARPCGDTDRKREALLTELHVAQPVNTVWDDRVAGMVALRFIADNPITYLKLCLRRLWTLVLPYNPRADQRPIQRAAFALHWAAVVPGGLIGALVCLRRPRTHPALLGLLIAVNLATLAAVLIHQDLRFRVGVDLLLGSFGGWGYCRWFGSSPAS
jgi:dolichyl-phosphate-mannose-protein mannosyltransferase